MWLFQGGPQSPTEIRALLLELLGPDESAAFWQKYRENYVSPDDIALLHKAGFNAVRVPLHYSLFESDDADGFKLLDQLIVWCRAEGLCVVLDMHVAPGGQAGTNIDDSAGYPWLYQSREAQEHLIAVWRRLAGRYRDERTVLGYDLLNEPIPTYPSLKALNPFLEPLYKSLSGEIRKVDIHHILFLGGAQWDSNFSIFDKPFDPNVAYTFHKYWTVPDESVLKEYIDFRQRYDVPIWMGESGENTDDWIAQFVKELEKNDIGWAFWPYKKMERHRRSLASLHLPIGAKSWDPTSALSTARAPLINRTARKPETKDWLIACRSAFWTAGSRLAGTTAPASFTRWASSAW